MSPAIIGGIIGGVVTALVLVYRSIVNTPQGKVEFKTGLVLKMLARNKGPIDFKTLRVEYDKMGHMGSKKLKGKVPENEVMIPTRHGDVKTVAFTQDKGGELPLILYFHAGGWCIGSIASHRESCLRTSMATGMSMLSVEYSKAPEYPYPRAMEECLDILEWVISEADFDFADTSKIILMGESAGAHISIVLALDQMKKASSNKILEVVAAYPPVNLIREEKQGSFDQFDTGYVLTKELMEKFDESYFLNVDVDKNDSMISPIKHEDFKGYPDTYIITAYYDPLRDEGEAFGEKLKSAGVSTVVKRYDRAVHDFYGKAIFGKQGLKAVDDLATHLKSKYA